LYSICTLALTKISRQGMTKVVAQGNIGLTTKLKSIKGISKVGIVGIMGKKKCFNCVLASPLGLMAFPWCPLSQFANISQGAGLKIQTSLFSKIVD